MEKAYDVYRTTDYESFKHLEGNRGIAKRRVTKIRSSIESTRYVRNPIVVNKNMEIIDGQGRFEALKQLGMPVEYIIDPDAGLDECVALNLSQTNWKTLDYVESYVERGMEDYVRLLDTYQSHKLSFGILTGIIYNKIVVHGQLTRRVTSGELVFTEQDRSDLEWVLNFLDVNKSNIDLNKGDKRTKYTLIAWVLRNTNVDVKRLQEKIETSMAVLPPIKDPVLSLMDLADVYNYRLSDKNKIYFDAIYRTSGGWK